MNKNEYFLIQTKDNQKLIYDGSLLIKFIDIPNFQEYAAMNDLIFIKDKREFEGLLIIKFESSSLLITLQLKFKIFFIFLANSNLVVDPEFE